ncbi:MAG: hypothetical protein KY460_00070 [Actinobacteria bacterium]|nr:hypothetical protein [Actinomycetota bacterium]
MTAQVIGLLAVTVVLLRARHEHRDRRGQTADRWWPWFVGAVEHELDRDGADVATATLRAGLGGPPPLRDATRAVVRAAPDADAVALIDMLRGRVATAAGDRLFGTVAALHERGAPAGAALAWLRGDASAAAAHACACAGVAAGGTVARWLLLVPLVPVVGSDLPTGGRWSAAVLAVGLWWCAGRWLRPYPSARVFAADPTGPRQ